MTAHKAANRQLPSCGWTFLGFPSLTAMQGICNLSAQPGLTGLKSGELETRVHSQCMGLPDPNTSPNKDGAQACTARSPALHLADGSSLAGKPGGGRDEGDADSDLFDPELRKATTPYIEGGSCTADRPGASSNLTVSLRGSGAVAAPCGWQQSSGQARCWQK